MSTTLGRYLHPKALLPWTGADEPLGAGLVQVQASNATQLARQHALRTLLWHPGRVDVWAMASDLTDPETYTWDAEVGDDGGGFVLCTGAFLLRPYGETAQLPNVRWRFRWKAKAGFTLAALAVVTPGWQRPSTVYPYALDSTVVNAYQDGNLLVDMNANAFTPARQAYGLQGEMPVAVAWLAFTSDSGAKTDVSEVSGVTCYLEAP